MSVTNFSSFETMNMAPQPHNSDNAAQVAEKVMRRIEIAKVARNLQDCLAFASFKAQNGWQDRTLSTIEPEITEKLARRKRPLPDDIHSSDSLSTLSEDAFNSIPSSSQPTYSSNAAKSYTESRKRVRASSSSELERGGQQHASWRPQTSLAEAASAMERSHALNNRRDEAYPAMQDSTMFDAPSTPDYRNEDDNVPKLQEPSSSIVSTSPPRTPPPTRRNLASTKQAGADLLLYLANSPKTPAVHIQHLSSTQKDPATPSQHAGLPSSHMQTPGQLGLFNGALHTPGNFNLADFCNVTPSPGQAQFPRQQTPALGCTPHNSTRRSLNFDALLPPSPTNQKSASGLALHLGDELRR